MTEDPGLFDAPAPARPPDPFEGLGHDARRTLVQLDLIEQGYNPGTRVPLHRDAAKGREGPGLRCLMCVHLYRTGAGNKTFYKCREAGVWNSRGSWGPDIRMWWPACRLFDPKGDEPTSQE